MSFRPCLFAALLALVPMSAQAETVTVFAAASLKTALDGIAADWQAATGDTVAVSYGGSPVLAKQIIEGAPADIYISASPDWMDRVAEAGLVADGSRVDLLGNTLVLVAHGKDIPPANVDDLSDFPAMLGQGKLAMALVDSVPAGVYGKEVLTALGLWDKVAGQVVQADNVRAALTLVATGEAMFGIVYATDVAPGDDVGFVTVFPDNLHAPILYPAALMATASPEATAFFNALKGAEARAMFEEQGFKVLLK